MVMSSAEDEVAQLKGVCNVALCPGSQSSNANISIGDFWEVMIKGGAMLSNLPIKPTALHFCYENPGMEFALAAYRRVFGKPNRLRLRAHFGKYDNLHHCHCESSTCRLGFLNHTL